MKKIVITVVASALLITSALSVSAAGLKDVFSAKYYADQYPDLYNAFGYDEEALWNHFMTYGLEEGRNMSPILDVQLYREKYADLDAAFGDNWDAYVDHYFTYGIKEKRENGTNFDVLTYLEAYDDIEAAFGDDYVAAAEHYLTFGMEEGRDKGDPVIYEASVSAPAGGSSSNTPDIGIDDPGKVDYDMEEVYDGNGRLVKVLYTYEGKLYYYDMYYYDANGVRIKMVSYVAADDSVEYYVLYEYNTAGNLVKKTSYRPDDSLMSVTEYNDKGVQIKYTWYGTNGSSRTVEYSDSGAVVKETYTNSEGYVTVTEYDDQGLPAKVTGTDPNGNMTSLIEYFTAEDGSRRFKETYYMGDNGYAVGIFDMNYKMYSYESYAEDGSLRFKSTNKYNAEGKLIEQYSVYDGGRSSITTYDQNEERAKTVYYDQDGNATDYCTYEYNHRADGYTETARYYGMDDNMKYYCVTEYGADGGWLSSATYNPDGTKIN